MPLAIKKMKYKEINQEAIETFIKGSNPMERVVSIECDYSDDVVSIIYVDEDGSKKVRKEPFKPYVWVKIDACVQMFGGNRALLKQALNRYGISVKALDTSYEGQTSKNERLDGGFKFMFYSKKKMTFSTFLKFFREAGTPIYSTKKGNTGTNKSFLIVSPVEQFMIQTGIRLFKGYDSYDDVKRMSFDIETQGLNPKIHRIEQIGIRTNKGFEKIITITGSTEKEKDAAEIAAMDETLSIIAKEVPDVIFGHNSENFDWDFFIQRCEVLGKDFSDMSLKYFRHPLYKKNKESVLKLGGEMEYYKPTILWGFNIVDSLHAARRAQALDSNMKSANLKYVTEYLGWKKENRVYVPGNKISKTWAITDEKFAFNNQNGDWYEITEKKPIKEGYIKTSGRYIVERYLLDDIWEADKVELTLNESNFQVSKLLPTSFTRACTMGTAGIWKLIMLAWCFENDLAVPALSKNRRFVGGLSRLLRVGRVPNIVKLDYNSLYPSIDLTWNVKTDLDVTNIMLHLLEYILTSREKYKGLKGEYGKKADEIKEKIKQTTDEHEKRVLEEKLHEYKALKSKYDKLQLPFKILANSFFGSYGSPMVFPFGDLLAAEKTTCIGRMSLRLMIHHFSNLSKFNGKNLDKDYDYEPIVGDSFTSDTPLFIKYDDGHIDIKPINELINNSKIKIDGIGREYDTSEKPFKVLCRSGWVKPEYIYRHKTDKPIYEVCEGDTDVEITEDHSVFDNEKTKIKPSEIASNTKLEYYQFVKNVFDGPKFDLSEPQTKLYAKMVMAKSIDRVPMTILNATDEIKKLFLDEIKDHDFSNASKTCKAGILFLKNYL